MKMDINETNPHRAAWLSESASEAPTVWDTWVDIVEGLLGHDLDGNQEKDGYSLDFAYDCFKADMKPITYAQKVERAKARRRE